MITVRVPATSANIGPGFDCLGLALGLYNDIGFEESGEELQISGCEEKYRGADNLAYQGYLNALAYCGMEPPKGLKIHISADIPVSRGLGSSAALTVAGIAAASELRGMSLSKEEMLVIANNMEGHPDNAAPAIYGGLTAAIVENSKPIVMRYEVCRSLKFTALIPDYETLTEEARAMLPGTVDRADGVYTVGRLAVMLKALELGDMEALAASLLDKLHQPYRKKLIPGFDEIRSIAMENGAAGLVISGSGSTLLAVGGEGNFDVRMQNALKDIPGSWVVKTLGVDYEGVRVR